MKGYFFNAQATTDIVVHPSGFDREYDADDFNRYMGLFFTSGVFVRDDPDACKVIATPGAKPPADGISFRPGVVLVDGGQCHIESTDRVIVKPNPLGTAFTSIMCRRNNASDVRGFELVAIGATDDYPFPVREGDIYDMCLAIMDVEPDGTISWVQDTRNDPDYCGYAALTGQPPYYPPEDSNLPYIFWLYTLGYPMTAQQKAAVVSNPSLMAIYNQTRIGLIERGSWPRIATYETAGAYTWIAPDLFGDGKAYEIGVWMCGGGGAGGALLAQNRTSDVHMAAGGGSGRARCFKMTVTPGNSYNLVVGAGGAAAAMSTSLFINGNSGGSSAFSGNTVSGGEGGKYVDIDHTYTNIITVPPAMGAQCSIGLKYP
ncbi:MAG TPA: hypothetical protein VN421_09440, partial [Pseudoflavonifractor sp.]|nr:hypothetical protein [Pseudoflavonifractor sp.]